MTPSQPSDRRQRWIPRPRPEWVDRINEEGRVFDSRSVVPLDESSLLDYATRNTGLDDFGEDEWREPFQILLRSIDEEADLNLMGRLTTRSDLLTHLEGRLQIVDWYKQHPEVEEEDAVWADSRGREDPPSPTAKEPSGDARKTIKGD